MGANCQEIRTAVHAIIALTEDMFVIPKTKHIASKMFDFPEPFSPVMALKEGSHPVICVRTG